METNEIQKLISKRETIQQDYVQWSWKWLELIYEFIQDLKHLKDKPESDYVKVPKDIYDKMVGECTLAAIRRWDFVDKPESVDEWYTEEQLAIMADRDNMWK